MIVCSCNVISDRQVRDVVSERGTRITSQVYGCLGCSAQCGRCARTIRKIMDQALLACAKDCACCAAGGREEAHAEPHRLGEPAHEHDHPGQPVQTAAPAAHEHGSVRSGHAQLTHPHPVHGVPD
ncbi:(2Fe-2S)-binding protein [Rhodoplanes roseus]|uniref:Bacterioferritin-associated ferredoxin n=1 Tax=Rhodoplanes roseus TaxID=29409 RepID=A0A327KZZ2_9BRAD|nr:(2Fe-2S)-binding protein [Rhodoplanes roseus]RAI44450.1 hypothetical protein CH341_08975 [Rhodoplanes roseus]